MEEIKASYLVSNVTKCVPFKGYRLGGQLVME